MSENVLKKGRCVCVTSVTDGVGVVTWTRPPRAGIPLT